MLPHSASAAQNVWTAPEPVVVDGLRIHWSRTGESPRALIFVHGWICDRTVWRDQVPAFSRDYSVVALDLPGHGQSDSPSVFSAELFARSIEAVRMAARVERVALVGHSLGAQVALRYALLHAPRVVALVFAEGVLAAPRMLGLAARHLSRPNGRRQLELVIDTLFTPDTLPETRRDIVSMMLSAPPAAALGTVDAMLSPAAWIEEGLSLPALGVYREKSRFFPPDAVRARFPGLELVEMPGAGHFLMLEKPGEFNLHLQRFLANQTF